MYVGNLDGETVGVSVGDTVGDIVGNFDGDADGTLLGGGVKGLYVGGRVGTGSSHSKGIRGTARTRIRRQMHISLFCSLVSYKISPFSSHFTLPGP